MDHSRSRPELPPTTEAPALGRSNVYAANETMRSLPTSNYGETKELALTESEEDAFRAQSKNLHSQRMIHEKTLAKMMRKLPYQTRESLSSYINMILTKSEESQQDLEIRHKEIVYLRGELHRANREAHMMQRNAENYQERLRGLETNVDGLKDNLESRQRVSLKSKSAMARMSSTNKMLIDSLDALQADSQKNKKNSKVILDPIRRSVSHGGGDQPGGIKNSSSHNINSPPGSPHGGPVGTDTVTTDPNGNDLKISVFQQDKLRESLLRVAREHYKSMKNAEILDAKVGELRARLKATEQHNRKLKSEIDELRSLQTEQNAYKEVVVVENVKMSKEKSFGIIDDRFKNLIENNGIDPVDGLQQLRRILAHMSTIPSRLSTQDTIAHIVSREAIRIFNARMICLYLLKEGSHSVVEKYTVRTSEPTGQFDLEETTALAVDTITTGKVLRVNVLKNYPSYNDDIDGCPGVITRRIISLPLINNDNIVFGALHIINKGNTNDVFSEVDELFGVMYADQCSLQLSSTRLFTKMYERSYLLQCLLEASTSLYSVIPEIGAIANSKPLGPGEILDQLEVLARDTLKCSKTRAFLVSECVGMEPGHLVRLEGHSGPSVPRATRIQALQLVARHSGIAGHVVNTRKTYQTEDAGFDPFINPLADLDPLTSAMVTLPILDLYGGVLGCLQLVVGPFSPRMRPNAEDDPVVGEDKKPSLAQQTHHILFPQAAEWLIHQVTTPLQYLMHFVGRAAARPIATPKSISSVHGGRGGGSAGGFSTLNSPAPPFFNDNGEPITNAEGSFRTLLALPSSRHAAASGALPIPVEDEDEFKSLQLKDTEEDEDAVVVTDQMGFSPVRGLNHHQKPTQSRVDRSFLRECALEQAAEDNAKQVEKELKIEKEARQILLKDLQEALQATEEEKKGKDELKVQIEKSKEEIDRLQNSISDYSSRESILNFKLHEAEDTLALLRTNFTKLKEESEVMKVKLEASDAKSNKPDSAAIRSQTTSPRVNQQKEEEEKKHKEEEEKKHKELIQQELQSKYDQQIHELTLKLQQQEEEKQQKHKEYTQKEEETKKLEAENTKNAATAQKMTSQVDEMTIQIAELTSQLDAAKATIEKQQNATVVSSSDDKKINENESDSSSSTAAATNEDHKAALMALTDELKAAKEHSNKINEESAQAMQAKQHAEEALREKELALAEAEKRVELIQKEKASMDVTNAELNTQIEALRAEVKQKEALQVILQDQLVKMAGNNIRDLDAAVSSPMNQHAGGNTSFGEEGSLTSSNEHQVEEGGANSGAIRRGDWVQAYDESSQAEYWINEVTGESSWELPADVQGEYTEGGGYSGGGYGGGGENAHQDSPGGSVGSATAGGYTIEV